jgi:ribosomal protein S18 acetylase RimI-like enzyme
MLNIVYRPIQRTDYRDITYLVEATWPFHTYIRNKKTLHKFLRLVLMGCLLSSSYGRVALKDGKVIGFILGKTKQCRSSFWHMHLFIESIKYFIAILFANKPDRQSIFQYLAIPKIYKTMKPHEVYDGEIVFFAVDKQCRGLGVGTTLLNDLKQYFTQTSARRIYVFTDSNSNFGFYDYQGFTLLNKQSITLATKPIPLEQKIFLYSINY